MFRSDLMDIIRELYAAIFQLRIISCGYNNCCVNKY